MTLNEELNKYFDVLCNGNYPEFIEKYFETKELKRLKEVGQFCGCDYNRLYNIRYWYSRFDHSVATALITWNLTKDKTQTLAALFHDLGTPIFSHCIDFMLGDSINQETSERSVKDVIMDSPDICKLLELDEINLNNVADVSIYPIIENEKPKLCADRLEGVLHTVLIWLNTWQLEKVKTVYKSIQILINEEGNPEIGFKDIKSAENFFKAVYEYSIALQSNEDKFTMQYIADSVKQLIDNNRIRKADLYKLSEKDVVNILKDSIKSWKVFSQANVIERTNEKPENFYYVSVDTKKRYVIPLCIFDGKPTRLDKVSTETKSLLSKYKIFEDSKYSYVKGIKIG
jgi:hypothetical protein